METAKSDACNFSIFHKKNNTLTVYTISFNCSALECIFGIRNKRKNRRNIFFWWTGRIPLFTPPQTQAFSWAAIFYAGQTVVLILQNRLTDSSFNCRKAFKMSTWKTNLSHTTGACSAKNATTSTSCTPPALQTNLIVDRRISSAPTCTSPNYYFFLLLLYEGLGNWVRNFNCQSQYIRTYLQQQYHTEIISGICYAIF